MHWFFLSSSGFAVVAFYVLNVLVTGTGIALALLAWRRAARAERPVPTWARDYLPVIHHPVELSRFEHEPTRERALEALLVAFIPGVQTYFAIEMLWSLTWYVLLEGIARLVWSSQEAMARWFVRPL